MKGREPIPGGRWGGGGEEEDGVGAREEMEEGH